jgi:hypothetical protein
MSRHARRSVPVPVRRRALACLLALATATPVDAQTIADYSRAQRLLLESAMAQAAARSAGLGASTPASGTPAPASATGLPALPARTSPPSMSRAVALPSAPAALQVSGVFVSSQGVLAEVVIDATPHLLGPGQGVPGTAWHVESIAVDEVVLARRGGVAAGAGAPGVRQVFPLPALR